MREFLPGHASWQEALAHAKLLLALPVPVSIDMYGLGWSRLRVRPRKIAQARGRRQVRRNASLAQDGYGGADRGLLTPPSTTRLRCAKLLPRLDRRTDLE